MTPPPPASTSTSKEATSSDPAPPEDDVSDVGAAASVRVAVSTFGAPVAEDDVVPAAVGAVLAAVVDDAVARVDAFVGRVARGVLPPPVPAPTVLVGRLVDVRDVGRLVLDFFGRDGEGGRTAGGLPAPNAHPSTVPLLGWVAAAPTVLYDQEPPGLARQYDQYAVVGAPLQGSGSRSIVHTKPCWRGR
jgi:hypothetical protein